VRSLSSYLDLIVESDRAERSLGAAASTAPTSTFAPTAALLPALIAPTSSAPAPAPAVEPNIARRAGQYGLDWSATIADARNLADIATFRTLVTRLGVQTETLYTAMRRRYMLADARIQFEEPRLIVEMPALPGGECPKNGPFAYVYADVFAAAKEHLRLLGNNPPPRWTQPTYVLEWQKLVSFNVQILLIATNIRPGFLFPTATGSRLVDRPGVDRNEAVTNNWRTADKATKRTLMSIGSNGEPQFKEGARERWSHSTAFGVRPRLVDGYMLPQGVLDMMAALPPVQERRALAPAGVVATGWYKPLDGAPILQNGRYVGATPFERTVTIGTTRALANAPTMARVGSIDRIQEHALSVRLINDAWLNPTRPHVGRITGTDANGLYMADESSFWVTRWIEQWDQIALAFSKLDLDQMLLDALGFYVFNHNVWYAASLGLPFEQIRSMQVAMQQAAMQGQPVVAAVRGVTTAVAGAINPVAGAVVNVINQFGNLTMQWVFEAFETDAPRTLFVRNPPLACRPTELLIEAPPGAPKSGGGLVPTGGGFVFPSTVRVDARLPTPPPTPAQAKKGSGVLAIGAGVALLAFFLRR
jgi:hypothetical protein